MDRDRILGLLVLVLAFQGMLLYANPSVHLLYTRLKALETELVKSKPTATLRTGVLLDSTPKTAEGLFSNSRLLVVTYSPHTGTEALLLSRAGVYRNRLEVIKFGGPVDVGEQFYLHDNKRIPNCERVVEGVYFGGDVKRSEEVSTRILTFAGKMQWGAGELEAEIAKGLWRVGPLAKAEYVFADLRLA